LTEAGAAALRDWLASDDELLYEVRDEGMLKLFFSDSLPERRLENIHAMRALHENKLSQLRAIERKADHMHPGPRLTLQLGISLTQGVIEWCEAAERRLAEE
jgi:hypothetical protein